MLYDFCDMFTIDTSISYSDSSTPLRDIALLKDVLNSMLQLRMCYQTYRPIIVKVRPEIPEASLDDLLDFARLSGIDAICVSFGPACAATIKTINEKTQGRYPIVGCVDVLRKKDCAALKKAGACLIAGGLNFFHCGPGNTKRVIKYLNTIK
jgi:dihydroorotate dehydrogenase